MLIPIGAIGLGGWALLREPRHVRRERERLEAKQQLELNVQTQAAYDRMVGRPQREIIE